MLNHSFLGVAPSPKQPIRHSDAHAPPPSPILPPNKGYHSNASSPSTSFPSYQFPNDNNTAQASSYFISPIASSQPGLIILNIVTCCLICIYCLVVDI